MTEEYVDTMKTFDELKAHLGHPLLMSYVWSDENIAIECVRCGEVLVGVTKGGS